MELAKNYRLFQRFIGKRIHSLYPARCLICKQPAQGAYDICKHCYQRLPWNTNSCRQCALPLSYRLTMADVSTNLPEILCGRCQKRSPFFDYSYSLFRYDGEIAQLIHRLKFEQYLVCSRLLGRMLADVMSANLKATGDYPDCLLPVPLHKKRLRQRGFNQSIELARILSSELSIPLNMNDLARVRATLAQSNLNAAQRRENIRGAFELRGSIQANHVAIVDDVVTTGSTVNEMARLLKRHGVGRVDVYSIARA